jgi:hypothetical protein
MIMPHVYIAFLSFQRPFTYVVSFHLLNNPARKQGESDPHLARTDMQPADSEECIQRHGASSGLMLDQDQANIPRPVLLKMRFLDQQCQHHLGIC